MSVADLADGWWLPSAEPRLTRRQYPYWIYAQPQAQHITVSTTSVIGLDPPVLAFSSAIPVPSMTGRFSRHAYRDLLRGIYVGEPVPSDPNENPSHYTDVSVLRSRKQPPRASYQPPPFHNDPGGPFIPGEEMEWSVQAGVSVRFAGQRRQYATGAISPDMQRIGVYLGGLAPMGPDHGTRRQARPGPTANHQGDLLHQPPIYVWPDVWPGVPRHFRGRPVSPQPRPICPEAAVPYTAWTLLIAPSLIGQDPVVGGTLSASTAYFYVVTTLTAAGESTASNELTNSTTVTDLSFLLTWVAVTGASGYRIYRGTSSGATNTLVTQVNSGSTVTYTDTGTSLGTKSPPSTNTAGLNTNWEDSSNAWQVVWPGPRFPRNKRLTERNESVLPYLVEGGYGFTFGWYQPFASGVRPSRPLNAGGQSPGPGLPIEFGAILDWHQPLSEPLAKAWRPFRPNVPAEADQVSYYGSLTPDVLVVWNLVPAIPVRLPRRVPEAPASVDGRPPEDNTAWVSALTVQPQRVLPRGPGPARFEFTANPPWQAAGSTITTIGPFYTVAGMVHVAGAVAGKVRSGG